jgi:uncharacterized protein involved in exopolysaccharide biosynthesis/Mrp family chromosome partitioning ATPase
MSGVVNNHQDVDIDIGQMFRAIWARKGIVAGLTCGVAIAAFLGTSLLTKDYRSEARVLIELRDTASGAKSETLSTDPVLDTLGIASQVQLLTSVDLIKKVARDMKLYNLSEFQSSKSGFFYRLLGLGGPADGQAPEDDVIDAFNKKLSVFQMDGSRVIAIQFTSEDPKLAAEIPNRLAEAYLALQSNAKLDSNSQASAWLEPEIADLREKVRVAEEKVATYRASQDLLPAGQDSSFADRQLNDISAELVKVRSERATSEARAESVRAAIRNGGSADALTEVIASPTIQRLKETELTVQGRLSDLSITLLENHPTLKGLRAQLNGIRQQMTVETRKILASLESEAEIGRSKERQLVQQLNTLKAESARAGEEEVGLKALEREAAAQRDLLESYLARYRSAASRSGENATPADARVISNAIEPVEAIFPKKIPITIVAALATFLLTSVVIMLSELFSGRALKPTVNAAEITVEEPNAKAQVMARRQVPEAVIQPVQEEPLGANSPSSNVLSPDAPVPQPVALTDAMPDPEVNPFSVATVASHLVETSVPLAICVSPTGDNGSTAAVMLARAIAEMNRSVILMDLTETGWPTSLMAESVNLPGIADLLAGQATIANCIHADRLSNVHIIPTGNADHATAMRGMDRLAMIAQSLSGAYDIVLIETGQPAIADLPRISRNTAAEIVLSVPAMVDFDMADIMEAFKAAGYEEVVLLSAMVDNPNPGMRKKSA